MLVFRISAAKWADSLEGSGLAARWNSNGVFVCYTAASRALGCLEMVVHLSGEKIINSFKIISITIPPSLKIEDIAPFKNIDWAEFENLYQTQAIGDEWVKSLRTCVLRVPSAIIPGDFNYIINPRHTDFNFIEISEMKDFEFDLRLKN